MLWPKVENEIVYPRGVEWKKSTSLPDALLMRISYANELGTAFSSLAMAYLPNHSTGSRMNLLRAMVGLLPNCPFCCLGGKRSRGLVQ